MFNSENAQKKWAPILEHKDLPAIKDNYRKAVTAIILENQEKALREERANSSFQPLTETAANATTGGTGNLANWDPILISLVRRSMPNLIAYDIAGVQPMSGPTGLIFAMKSKYTSQGGDEALFQEANTAFSGTGAQAGDTSSLPDALGGLSGVDTTPADGLGDSFGLGTGMSTAAAEALGNTGGSFAQMAFSIEKATVTAKSRALKAEYTMELAQDLKAVHGLDAESELANILSAEILAEINREVIRTINSKAKLGAQTANVTTKGKFNLFTDADGRWNVERFKGLLIQIEREANQIAKDTRRGKGNFILCSSDVATALSAAGVLDYAPALSTQLEVDDTGNTFAGVLNGRTKVYIDPYATVDYITAGYRGTNPYDAGIFYAPYVPLTMVRAVGQSDFQPRIGFKTRYGMVANPFAEATGAAGVGAPANDTGTNRANRYFRIFGVTGILDNA
jgi:hypothetical protein